MQPFRQKSYSPLFWSGAAAVNPMAHAHDRVFPHHSRTGIAHDHPHLLASFPLVAVDRAFGAGRFLNAIAAAFQSKTCIGEKLFAFAAKVPGGLMMIAAIDAHHGLHGIPFARQAFAGEIIPGFHGRSGRWGPGLRFRFSNGIHAVILPRSPAPGLDSGQFYFIHWAVKKCTTH
jgi:hypothetical protein